MTAMPAALRIPRVRWGIGGLLGAGVLINYFDRINLSVGGPQLQQEFGLSAGELGWLFSGLF
jgi:ACS family D-galactonate transporter-like MFS transporter